MRDESIISKFQNGQIRLKSLGDDSAANPYKVDGVTVAASALSFPYPWTIGCSIASTEKGHRNLDPIVMNHPHRAALEQVFKDMASLGKEYQFDVTVLIAPTDSRLYASHFEDFPPISEEPYFINFVADLSREVGFQTVNLLPLLQPYAEKELLYFRDDDHWNARGNEVVAEILARNLSMKDARP